MRRALSSLATLVLWSGLAGVAMAQQASSPWRASAPNPVLGSVTNGNTTIVFEAANQRDIDSEPLLIWDAFAAAHPQIARSLAYKPSLMNDPGYLSTHQDLNLFFEAHPEVRQAMAANPGNFAAIPPRPGE